MNREEIQAKLSLTHRENFRKYYLKPALDAGLIEMTIPGKPNSKHQKYRLTEKGKQMKRAMRDNLTQTHDYRWRVLPIYIGTGYMTIKKQIINR